MEQTTPKELQSVLVEYRKRYGQGAVDIDKLDELIRERKNDR